VQWLEAEYAVMRTAIDDAEELFDDHVWQLAYALAVHLLPVGNHSELFAMQRIARAAADRTGYLDARARVLHDIGITHARTRRYDEATGYLEQAGELFVSADDRVGRAAVHVTLAYVSAMLDDYPAALRHTQRSAELYELAGDRVGRVRALNSMSGAYTGLGDYDRAIACSEESLAVYEELGDVPGTAGVWDDIGCAHHAAGRTDEAAVCYDRSLRLYRGIGARLMEGDMLKKLGDLGRDTGDPAGAVAFWRAAMEIFDDIGYDEAEDVRAEMLELEARL